MLERDITERARMLYYELGEMDTIALAGALLAMVLGDGVGTCTCYTMQDEEMLFARGATAMDYVQGAADCLSEFDR